MTDTPGPRFPPEAATLLRAETLAHLAALVATVASGVLALRLYPTWLPLLLAIPAVLALALTIFRRASRKLFKLPPDQTPWILRAGLVRWSSPARVRHLPAWKIYAGTYYAPGVGRSLGFGVALIAATVLILTLSGALLLPVWISIAVVAFVSFVATLSALSHNRLPPEDGRASLF